MVADRPDSVVVRFGSGLCELPKVGGKGAVFEGVWVERNTERRVVDAFLNVIPTRTSETHIFVSVPGQSQVPFRCTTT